MSNQFGAQSAPTTPGQVPRARGGSRFGGAVNQFNPTFTKSRDFFKAGPDGRSVVSFMPTGKKPVNGRILPCFDPVIAPTDPRYATSWLPCRFPEGDTVNVDKDGKTLMTEWCRAFKGHRMWGRQKRDIASPKNLAQYQVTQDELLTRDAIADVFFLVHKMGAEHAHWLDDKRGANNSFESAPISCFRDLSIMNMYARARDEDQPVNAVVVISSSGADATADLLDIYTPRNIKPRDPTCELYLYGDVTHPVTGLWARSGPIDVGGQMPPIGFMFSSVPGALTGAAPYAVNDDILRARYPLDTSIMNIPTYQEMIEWMVEEAIIPWEFINAACSWAAKPMPRPGPQHANAAYSQPGMQPGGMPQHGLPPQHAPVIPGGPPAGIPSGWQQSQTIPASAPDSGEDYIPMDHATQPALPVPVPQPVAQPAAQPVGGPPPRPVAPAGPPPRPATPAGPPPRPVAPPKPEATYWVTDAATQVTDANPVPESEVLRRMAAGQRVEIVKIGDPNQAWVMPSVHGLKVPQVEVAPAAAPVAAPVAQAEPVPQAGMPMGMTNLPPLSPDELIEMARLRAQITNASVPVEASVSLIYKALRDRAAANQQKA